MANQGQELIVISRNRGEEISNRLYDAAGIENSEICHVTVDGLQGTAGKILVWDATEVPLPPSPFRHPMLVLMPEGMTFAPVRARGVEVIRWPGEREEWRMKVQKLRRLQGAWEQRKDKNCGLVGCSEAFFHTIRLVERYAPCDVPLLITGETGTGKEKIARAIHACARGDRPFVAVNCGAIPETLFENELFGHVRGAYTDAKEGRRGLVECAEGGTLFLDEIEALPMKGQVVLLRFLQDYEYRPLGSQRTRRADLRVIVATNEPLEGMVSAGRFRRDLYYRINVLSIDLPPLRGRREDILCLADHFIDRYRDAYRQYEKYLSADTMEWMCRYHWPGNVRELENVLLRHFLLSEGARIRFGDGLPERRRNPIDRRRKALYSQPFQEAKARVVQEFERTYLCHLLQQTHGNVSEAARRAGKERRAFTKLMEKHGLARDQFLPR